MKIRVPDEETGMRLLERSRQFIHTTLAYMFYNFFSVYYLHALINSAFHFKGANKSMSSIDVYCADLQSVEFCMY